MVFHRSSSPFLTLAPACGLDLSLIHKKYGMEKMMNHRATKGPTKRVPSFASAFKPKIGSSPISVFPFFVLAFRHRHTSPGVIRETVDQRGHCVLRCETNIVHAVLKTKYFFEGSADPFDEFTFPSSRQTLNHMADRFIFRAVDHTAANLTRLLPTTAQNHP